MLKRESTGGSVAALLRDAITGHDKRRKKPTAKESAAPARFREANSVRPIEAAAPEAGAGPKIKIVLVDEGLGNKRNMNYYGPEAIASAAEVYEGKPTFANHPSESEETELPERDVLKQYGFYKGLKVEKLKNAAGKMADACTGWLHFDLSELGRQMYCKALTAIEYQKQFPDSGNQYIGWSVLGGGAGEARELDPAQDATGTLSEFDAPVEVNYVTRFTEGESCDAVTKAGRGGRVLAIAEDAHGKEVGMLKKLKATLAKFQESAKKATGEDKKVFEAAVKDLNASIKTLEADAAAVEGADPFHAMCDPQEGETEEAHAERLSAMAKHLSGKLKPAENEEPEPTDKPKAAAPDADTMEAKRAAVKAYAAEAGLPKGAYSDDKITRLSKLTYREAKAMIDDDARLAEASRNELAAEIEVPVASLRPGARETAGTVKIGRGNATLKESFSRED